MSYSIIKKERFSYLKLTLQHHQPLTITNINDLLALCYTHDTNRMMLYASHLPLNFFDISSKVAGDIMQKLSNYQVKTAVIMEPSTKTSSMFTQMSQEANKMSYIHFFTDELSAEKWLNS